MLSINIVCTVHVTVVSRFPVSYFFCENVAVIMHFSETITRSIYQNETK